MQSRCGSAYVANRRQTRSCLSTRKHGQAGLLTGEIAGEKFPFGSQFAFASGLQDQEWRENMDESVDQKDAVRVQDQLT